MKHLTDSFRRLLSSASSVPPCPHRGAIQIEVDGYRSKSLAAWTVGPEHSYESTAAAVCSEITSSRSYAKNSRIQLFTVKKSPGLSLQSFSI